MNTNDKLLSRVTELIELADSVIKTEKTSQGRLRSTSVDIEIFDTFRNGSLSFILSLFGKEHPYYQNFNAGCYKPTPFGTKSGRGILTSIKTEIEQGWLTSLRGLVSSEIFTDFIEMAEHLLSENYKDASAVMIGSVLEEHLRQLCSKQGIVITTTKAGKTRHKKADLLNAELAKEGVYNKLDQKSVTAWLDLRNKAAHGKYDEYTKEQVEFMLQSVMGFMTRNNI